MGLLIRVRFDMPKVTRNIVDGIREVQKLDLLGRH